MKKLLPLLLLFFVGSSLFAQEKAVESPVIIYGVVLDEGDKEPLSKAFVYVVTAGDTIESIKVGENGRFEYYSTFDTEMDLHFSSKGCVSKIVAIDTKNVPEAEREGGFGFDLDITLFKKEKKKDYSLYDEAIALAQYETASKSLSFNNAYTRKKQAEVKAFQFNQ